MQKQVNRKALTLNIHMRLASIIKLIEAEPHLSQREIDQKMGVIPHTSCRCNIGRDREPDWKPQYSELSTIIEHAWQWAVVDTQIYQVYLKVCNNVIYS